MNEEHDLWSAGFELGLLTERDRIIKIIEDYDWFAHALQEDGTQLIALIKAETNER